MPLRLTGTLETVGYVKSRNYYSSQRTDKAYEVIRAGYFEHSLCFVKLSSQPPFSNAGIKD